MLIKKCNLKCLMWENQKQGFNSSAKLPEYLMPKQSVTVQCLEYQALN